MNRKVTHRLFLSDKNMSPVMKLVIIILIIFNSIFILFFFILIIFLFFCIFLPIFVNNEH